MHLLDANSEDVVADLAVVERELENYGHGLADKPRLVVLNKGDVLDEAIQRERLAAVEQRAGAAWIQRRPLLISAATSQGLDPLKEAVWQHLEADQSS